MKKPPLVKVADIRPNEWNPNVFEIDAFDKLAKGVLRTWEKSGTIPPVILRSSPDETTKYQIVDGEHRWRVFRDSGIESIPALVLENIDDADAKVLTITLNYLRGSPDPEAYGEVLKEIIEDGIGIEDLAELIPEDEVGILESLSLVDGGIDLESVLAFIEEDTEPYPDTESKKEGWVEVSFMIPNSLAREVEECRDKLFSQYAEIHREDSEGVVYRNFEQTLMSRILHHIQKIEWV